MGLPLRVSLEIGEAVPGLGFDFKECFVTGFS